MTRLRGPWWALCLAACTSSTHDPFAGAGTGGSGEVAATTGGGTAGAGIDAKTPEGSGGSAVEDGSAGAGGNEGFEAGDALQEGDASDLGDAVAGRDAPLDAKGDGEAGTFDAGMREAGASYDPCPPKGQPCVALPLGDSITQGAHSPSGGGYRQELFHMAVSHGQSIKFVGSVASGPVTVDGAPFPRAHEGHGGYSISLLADFVTMNDTIHVYKPDIVLLEIGTNGVNDCTTCNVDTQIMRLESFVDQILTADSRLFLVVAQITATKRDARNDLEVKYNAAVRAIVKKKADAGQHVATVDLYTPMIDYPNYKTALLADEVHPNGAGYTVVGDAWYTVVGPLLR